MLRWLPLLIFLSACKHWGLKSSPAIKVPKNFQPISNVDGEKLVLDGLSVAIEPINAINYAAIYAVNDRLADFVQFVICSKENPELCSPAEESPGVFTVSPHYYPEAPEGENKVMARACVLPERSTTKKLACGLWKEAFFIQPINALTDEEEKAYPEDFAKTCAEIDQAIKKYLEQAKAAPAKSPEHAKLTEAITELMAQGQKLRCELAAHASDDPKIWPAILIALGSGAVASGAAKALTDDSKKPAIPAGLLPPPPPPSSSPPADIGPEEGDNRKRFTADDIVPDLEKIISELQYESVHFYDPTKDLQSRLAKLQDKELPDLSELEAKIREQGESGEALLKLEAERTRLEAEKRRKTTLDIQITRLEEDKSYYVELARYLQEYEVTNNAELASNAAREKRLQEESVTALQKLDDLLRRINNPDLQANLQRVSDLDRSLAQIETRKKQLLKGLLQNLVIVKSAWVADPTTRKKWNEDLPQFIDYVIKQKLGEFFEPDGHLKDDVRQIFIDLAKSSQWSSLRDNFAALNKSRFDDFIQKMAEIEKVKVKVQKQRVNQRKTLDTLKRKSDADLSELKDLFDKKDRVLLELDSLQANKLELQKYIKNIQLEQAYARVRQGQIKEQQTRLLTQREEIDVRKIEQDLVRIQIEIDGKNISEDSDLQKELKRLSAERDKIEEENAERRKQRSDIEDSLSDIATEKEVRLGAALSDREMRMKQATIIAVDLKERISAPDLPPVTVKNVPKPRRLDIDLDTKIRPSVVQPQKPKKGLDGKINLSSAALMGLGATMIALGVGGALALTEETTQELYPDSVLELFDRLNELGARLIEQRKEKYRILYAH